MYNLEKPCVHKILQDPVLDLRLAIRFVRHVRKEARQYTTYSKQEGKKNKTTKKMHLVTTARIGKDRMSSRALVILSPLACAVLF